MKKKSIIGLVIGLLFSLSACSGVSVSRNADSNVIAPKSEMSVIPSDEQVSEFAEEMKDGAASYNRDKCYNITPDFIAENSDYMIFKYDKSTSSLIVYEGESYSVGTCFGGYGITSMALADLNGDGKSELYYTFSWGSGIHRSQIGYFDPAGKEVTVFDYELYDRDMMLTVNESGILCVNSAELDICSCVDFSIKPCEKIGTIESEGGRIELDID